MLYKDIRSFFGGCFGGKRPKRSDGFYLIKLLCVTVDIIVKSVFGVPVIPVDYLCLFTVLFISFLFVLFIAEQGIKAGYCFCGKRLLANSVYP